MLRKARMPPIVEKFWLVNRAVDEDQRCSCALLAIEIGVVFARRHDDDPVNTTVAKGTDQLAFAKWVLVATPSEDENASSAGCVLDRSMERRGERVRDVLQDEPNRLRLAAKPSQHGRIGVAAIVELRDRSPNLRFQSRADPRLVVDDPRNGLEADTSERGHVEHGRTTRDWGGRVL